MHYGSRSQTSTIQLLLCFDLLLSSYRVTCDQVYQPVQSEIERFKMIHAQIQMQQQQDQQQGFSEGRPAGDAQQEVESQQAEGRIRGPPVLVEGPPQFISRHPNPFLNHLLGRLTGQDRVPGPFVPVPYSPLGQESQLNPQHHLPEPVHTLGSNHLPVLPQFPQVPASQQHLAAQESAQNQLNPSNSLQNAPHLNPDSFRLLMHKNLALPGEIPSLGGDRKHLEATEEDNLENKNSERTLDFEDSQDDRHHQRAEDRLGHKLKHHSSLISGPRRCYACSWSIALCHDFNCYNNPDICTNNHFKAHRVHQADCPSGCEQYVVTDPNGLIQTWKRGCAPPSLPMKGHRCKTHYEFGIRIDRCICNKDWCNWAHSVHGRSAWLIVFTLSVHLLLSRLLQ